MTNKILFASRALESPPREGGFVLLRDIANNLTNKKLTPYMLSSRDEKVGKIHPDRSFHNIGWGRREKIDFFRALLFRSTRYNLVHTAHIPTRANSRYMRILTSRARNRGVKFIQTITGLPKIDDAHLGELLWGDYLVFQSPGAQKRASNHTNTPSQVITPWPSSSRVRYSSRRRDDTRQSLGINGKTKLVVFPGEFNRMGIGIDFSECLEAFIAKNEECLIILACRFDTDGTGDKLQKMYEKNVRSVGSASNIIELMEAADLVIFPTKKMSSKFHPPLIITEALSLGTPVLVSDLIDMDDSDIPLLTRIDRPTTWKEFGEHMDIVTRSVKSREGASNGFAEMLESYESIYKSLLERE